MIKKIFIIPIKFYQMFISPLLCSNCRHTPTCSQYMMDAINIYGVVKGIWLGIKRLVRCNPWGTCGHDPVINNCKEKL